MVFQVYEDDIEEVKGGETDFVVWTVLQSLRQACVGCFEAVQDIASSRGLATIQDKHDSRPTVAY